MAELLPYDDKYITAHYRFWREIYRFMEGNIYLFVFDNDMSLRKIISSKMIYD
jgi:hypothetical protein